jgi:hypothetical protein
MSLTKIAIATLSIIAALGSLPKLNGQTLPTSMNFTVTGKFQNGISESANSILISDNTLTNGYAAGSDLHDAPSGFATAGPAGSAFFQWGKAGTNASYSHPSALWFEPLAVTNAAAEKPFTIGYVYFRNGTIETNTGASAVDLALTFDFSKPTGMTAMNNTFTSNLINTPNTGTAIQNADIASLSNTNAPIAYKDASGKTYYLSLSYKMDAATMSSTNSTAKEFHSLEGTVGKAELVGMFTTVSGTTVIPEASTALLGALGSLLLFRRKRA